jgi:lipopolysaccharide biosynthesis glycosyltransferase
VAIKRPGRVRRLLADLRHRETRRPALDRIRSKVSLIPGTLLRARSDAATDNPATDGHDSTVASRPDRWYVREWFRLAAAVAGSGRAPGSRAPDPRSATDITRLARRQRAEAGLAEALSQGEPLESATCSSVAALTDLQEWNAAWAMTEGVGRLPGGSTATALGRAVLHHRRRQFDRAWNAVQRLDDETLATFIPVEAVDAALSAGSAEALGRALSIGRAGEVMTTAVVVDLAGRFLAFGERERAAALVAELHSRPSMVLDERRRLALARVEDWLDRRPHPIPDHAIPIGVIDYTSPDFALASGNLGDHIQTLSLVANLARFSNVRFSGEDGLGTLAGELQGRVRPGLRLAHGAGAVNLIPIDRDFSTAGDVPTGTWLVAFGWHMHPLFDLRYDFPYHPNIRPLFVSFHVNRLDMLSDEALGYLRVHGPVGCRDWTTVFLLLSAGVDAFFTGCLTTTVDAIFPTREAAFRGGRAVGVIDVPERAAGPHARDIRSYSHQSDDVRYRSMADGMRAASERLTTYQRDLERVVTGRLHAYLPLTSLGVPVEFIPTHPGDVRFAGLIGLRPDEPRLDDIRDGIRSLIAETFEAILAGATEDDAYTLWRELTRERVAEARARFEAPAVDPPTTIDVTAAVASSWAGVRRSGPHELVDPATVSDVVLCFDQNVLTPAAVLIESLLANASGPIRLWILGRGVPDAYTAWLTTAFPSLPITFLPCDRIAYGSTGQPRRVPSRITISTMDRLLLPHMLSDVDRILYLDVDTLMLGDVSRLASIDLDSRPVAARDSNVSEASEWRAAGRQLDEPEATELRRRMGARHAYGSAALNAGVLLLDLDRMRRDDFTATQLAMVERFGLNDQDAMLAYVGPERVVLDAAWNALPVLEDPHDPALIHWASLDKPWDAALTYGQEDWLRYATRLHDRAGPAPTTDVVVSATPGSLADPIEIGPRTRSVSSKVEQVIDAVVREHLSYLDATSLRTLAAMVETIEADGIDGLIIEAGTARGGSAITMAAAKSTGRPMRVYDVFGMIPPPGERDGDDVHRRYATIASGRSKGIGDETYYGYRDDLVAEVRDSFERHGLPVADNRIELVEGRFEDTIRIAEPVALAHLDGDWYASTMVCLTMIAPRLTVGGRLVIDDYDTWSGCRAAVIEYFADRPGFRFERRGRLHIVRV